MKHSELINILKEKNEIIEYSLGNDIDITDIQIDSREIKEGDVYIAIKGYASDGHDFIESAIEKGAKFIISEKGFEIDDSRGGTETYPYDSAISWVQVGSSRKVEAIVAHLFYGDPSSDMKIVGITGTNGKTSTTYILESILADSGLKVGIIGTIGYKINGKLTTLNNTTPDALELVKILNEMKSSGVEIVVMEVSSHALSLYRVYGLNFDIVAFTNLTQDHLDFHKDMQDYYEAKKLLFTEYLENSNKSDKKMLVNIDDEYGAKLFAELKGDKYFMSIEGLNQVGHEGQYQKGHGGHPQGGALTQGFTVGDYRLQIDRTFLRLELEGQKVDIETALIGGYNLYNILTGVSIAKLLGVENKNIKKALSIVKQIPGRLEQVKDKPIFIDYAHTPDAVEKVTSTLKELTKGRLITILGAGGDRDKGKRPLMSLAGIKNSDFLILTSDNPRTEDPEIILNDLEEPLLKNYKDKYVRIKNRAEAISYAVKMLTPIDSLVICGKGHEDYQIIGHEKTHFSDYEEVLKNLF
jgi:UDP-N-acetylmuramoyl-L-alanyl-D-glutamate--2,6-diaminopimelate ligase